MCVCRQFVSYNPALDKGVHALPMQGCTKNNALAGPRLAVRASHSRDDQRGGEEQRSQQASSAVGVLPLALVHLAAAVVAAAAQAEEEADDGHEDGEQQAHRRAHQEPYLVIDGLGVVGGGWGDERRDEMNTGGEVQIEKHNVETGAGCVRRAG